jgi:hypothetical protein
MALHEDDWEEDPENVVDVKNNMEIQLLQEACRENGKRIGDLERRLDNQLNENLKLRALCKQLHRHVKTLAKRLGVNPEDPGSSGSENGANTDGNRQAAEAPRRRTSHG